MITMNTNIDISKCKRSACVTAVATGPATINNTTKDNGSLVVGYTTIEAVKYNRGLAIPKANSIPVFTKI